MPSNRPASNRRRNEPRQMVIDLRRDLQQLVVSPMAPDDLQPTKGTPVAARTPSGIEMAGCPVREKIDVKAMNGIGLAPSAL